MGNTKGFASNFTVNRRITPLLISFFEDKRYTPKIGRALDIGFGIGQDSRYLAESGYVVDAIDKDDIAVTKAKELNDHEKVHFMQQDIIAFDFVHDYDLIISFLSLFNLSKPQAKDVFSKIVGHMKAGGYLIMRLLGPQDERAEKITTRSKKELEELFGEYPDVKIRLSQESYAIKTTATQTMKNRHFVDIIVQKNV